jgi:hypothetical protein
MARSLLFKRAEKKSLTEQGKMKPIMHYPIIVLLFITLLIGQFSCVHTRGWEPRSLSEQEKAELGTIGVVSVRFKPETRVQTPLNKKDGAKAGALMGVNDVLSGGGGGSNPLGWAAYIILLPVTLPVAAGVGALIGSERGVSDSEKEGAWAVLDRVIAELKIQETMREHILNVAQRKTIYHFSLIEELGPTVSSYEKVNYNSLGSSGVNTVLEISVDKWRLNGKGIINPPLSFFMHATIRILRVEDGKELYNDTFTYESRKKNKFTKWAANNGQSLKEEFNCGYRSLAEKIVRELFLAPES